MRCLVCSTTGQPSVIGNVCAQCYQTGVYSPAHKHDKSFLSSDTDSVVKDATLPDALWEVKRNVYQRQWYAFTSTKFRTHIRPMTAVCGLPAGWQALRDQSGRLLYRDPAGQLVLQLPNALPEGWREAKDPDGKSFYVHDQLQLASWHRPDEQPAVQQTSVVSTVPDTVAASVIPDTPAESQVDAAARPQPIRIQTAPPTAQALQSIQRPPTAMALPTVPSPLPRPTLRTATEATVNLIDPSHGNLLRQSRIAGHIAGQGIISSVNAIKRNKPLQDFARGTGIALANRTVKRAWRKAAAEVDAAYGSGRPQRVEVGVTYAGASSAVGAQAGVIVEADDGYDGEYEVEYDDGTIVQFSADGKPLRVVTKSTPSSGVTSPVASPATPPLSRVSTGSSLPLDPMTRRASMPTRRPVGQAQQAGLSAAQQQLQQQQMLRIRVQQQQLQAQQQELERQLLVAQAQQPVGQTVIIDTYSQPPPVYVDVQPDLTIVDNFDTISIGSSNGGGGVIDMLSGF